MSSGPRSARWPTILVVAALAYLVAAVFYPIYWFDFIDYDTDTQVVQNPYIQGLTARNLYHIFTSRSITSYYPLRTLTYAFDCQVWGLWAGGFELTNGLIHLANVLLVFWLILRVLPAPVPASHRPWWDLLVAAFAAGLFAIHPAVVEPVAWLPGREELLMALGALGCLHFRLAARRMEVLGQGRKAVALHAAAAVACAAACLSNAAGAAIPLVVTAWDLVVPPRPGWRNIAAANLPLWAIAAITLVIKKLDPQGPRYAMDPALLSAERLRLVLGVYGHNLKTLVWPARLTLDYPLLTPSGAVQSHEWLGAIGLVLTGVSLWLVRRRTWVLVGLLWFLFALAPSSQILPHHIHRADRFLYLPLAGLALAAAAAIRAFRPVLKSRAVVLAAALVGLACLFVLQSASKRQVWTWQNSLTVWSHCVEVAPENPMGHSSLAAALARAGRFDQAVEEYERGLSLDAANYEIMNAYALILVNCQEPKIRNHPRAVELAQRAVALTGGRDSRLRRTLATVLTVYANDLYLHGQFAEALARYDDAIRADSSYTVALINQAVALATCKDERLRKPEEAIRMAEQACRTFGYGDWLSLSVLAKAYASTGRFDDAERTAQQAAALAQSAGDPSLVDQLSRETDSYAHRVPPAATP